MLLDGLSGQRCHSSCAGGVWTAIACASERPEHDLLIFQPWPGQLWSHTEPLKAFECLQAQSDVTVLDTLVLWNADRSAALNQ